MEEQVTNALEPKNVMELKSESLNGQDIKVLRRDLVEASEDKMVFKLTYIKDDSVFEYTETKTVAEVYNLINPSDTLENSTPNKQVLLLATLVKIQYPDLNVRLNELFKDGVSDKWTVSLEFNA